MLTTYLYNEMAYFAGGEGICRTLMPGKGPLSPPHHSIFTSWLQAPGGNPRSIGWYKSLILTYHVIGRQQSCSSIHNEVINTSFTLSHFVFQTDQIAVVSDIVKLSGNATKKHYTQITIWLLKSNKSSKLNDKMAFVIKMTPLSVFWSDELINLRPRNVFVVVHREKTG